MAVLASEVPPGFEDCPRTGLGIVAADGVLEGVGEHAAAVESLPPEQVEGHLVRLRPVHLDREEMLDAGQAKKLRQCRREAEAVGQPADIVAAAEGPFEIALPVQKLANEGF